VIALEAMFAGPICGASMNPVRSLAPAIVSWHIENLWVYLTAPTLGALAGVLTYRCIQEPASRITAVSKGEDNHERSEAQSIAGK
jgi:aquaporin Z